MKRFFPTLIIFLLLFGYMWAQEAIPEHRISLRQLVERADSGDPKALYDLAYLHDIGYDSIQVDSLLSTALYKKSAEKGYAPAMNFLGFRYYKGEKINKNIDSALFWIRKAADVGDITAAANLGYLLTESDEIPHDENEAVKWLTIAAEHGVNEAQLKLIDLKGETFRNLDADSALIIGTEYYVGKAPILGTFILEGAAEAGIPKAQALLGDAYSKGLGVPYDHQKAIDFYYEAARGGDPSAQFVIAELLEIFPDALNNLNIKTTEFETPAIEPRQSDTDIHTPSYWYEKAAAQGVTDSETATRSLLSIP